MTASPPAAPTVAQTTGLPCLPTRPAPPWLVQLTSLNGPFPLKQVLRESVYYPACGVDGTPVRLLGHHLHSYVYVDYGVGEEGLRRALVDAPFRGYSIVGERPVTKSELAPARSGWDEHAPWMDRRFISTPFARWIVFERQAAVPTHHGPSRFSLLYIGGEGVASFQALYRAQQIAPAALCIIQPGTGFGGNWTDFRRPRGHLARLVVQTPHLVPRLLVCGGDDANAYWPRYRTEVGSGRTDDGGRVVVYER